MTDLLNDAERVWEKDGVTCFFRRHRSHYCGYCRFPLRPVREQGYDGLLTYVPVHGGITYAQQGADGTMTYGFDCAHLNDETDPRCSDPDWLRSECETMATSILVAVDFEEAYLLAADNDRKGGAVLAFEEALKAKGLPAITASDNFGVAINLLCGRL